MSLAGSCKVHNLYDKKFHHLALKADGGEVDDGPDQDPMVMSTQAIMVPGLLSQKRQVNIFVYTLILIARWVAFIVYRNGGFFVVICSTLGPQSTGKSGSLPASPPFRRNFRSLASHNAREKRVRRMNREVQLRLDRVQQGRRKVQIRRYGSKDLGVISAVNGRSELRWLCSVGREVWRWDCELQLEGRRRSGVLSVWDGQGLHAEWELEVCSAEVQVLSRRMNFVLL
ncbi:hypothetical protein M5K25_013672 [Dendrobium thyrsiflorum]|uniref:Uncharacterized protein n=1 Tax=Dendrobium thyrsiflorum TaxID=117978 RepID=A0ABD0V0W4_DENTH